MAAQSSSRVWLSVIIGILVCIGLVWSTPDQVFTPHGLFLPGKIKRPPTANTNIMLYANAPSSYKDLGLIRLVRHYNSKTSKQAEKEIIQAARQMAAKAGANAILVKFFAHSVPGAGAAAQATYQFWGVAIYTNSFSNFDAQPLMSPLGAS